MKLRNKKDRYVIVEEDIVMDEGLQNPNQTQDAEYLLRVKCGNNLLPEMIDGIVDVMENYAKDKSERYATHYFNTRNQIKHPLGVYEYDVWDKLNNK